RNIEAYNLYLLGRHQFHKRTEDSLRSAVRFFEQAIERDPEFALPYTGLADAYSLLSASGEGYGQMPVEEALAQATPLVERALALDPRLAEAHASRGFIERLRGDFAASEKSLRRSLELKPDYSMAHTWLGLTLTDLGRLREARTRFQRAWEADPLSPIVGSNLGFVLLKAGEVEAARERFRQVLEISPEFTVAHSGMAQVERRAGHIEEAREWWQRAMRINPKRAYYPAGVALLELDEDDIDAAERALRQAESLAPNDVQVVRTRVALLVATGRDAELCGYTEGRLQGERSSDEALANAALAQLVAGHPKDALGYYRRVRGDLRQWVSDSLLWTWRFPHALYYAQALLATEAREPALALLADAERLFARLVEEGLVNPELDYERAMVLAMREDHDGAARAIERARADGWRAAWLARRDPTLAALRARGGLQL